MKPGIWIKSTYSSDSANCVEVQWARADCSDGMCVEVARDGDRWLVRDSKDPDGPVLVYTADEWDRIVRTATHDLPACLAFLGDYFAWVGKTAAGERTWLEFTTGEVDAWLAGVRDGQMRPATVPAIEAQAWGAC